MAYVLLYGAGWTQRWQVAPGGVSAVENEIGQVGQDKTGRLAIIDPGSGEPTTLMVAWRHIASAVVLGSDDGPVASVADEGSGGVYR